MERDGSDSDGAADEAREEQIVQSPFTATVAADAPTDTTIKDYRAGIIDAQGRWYPRED